MLSPAPQLGLPVSHISCTPSRHPSSAYQLATSAALLHGTVSSLLHHAQSGTVSSLLHTRHHVGPNSYRLQASWDGSRLNCVARHQRTPPLHRHSRVHGAPLPSTCNNATSSKPYRTLTRKIGNKNRRVYNDVLIFAAIVFMM